MEVHLAPHVDDVAEDKGDQEGDVHHRIEGVLRGGGVADRQRALQVSEGGVVGGVIPPGEEEEHRHRHHDTDTVVPDALGGVFLEDRHADAVEHQDDTDEERSEEGRLLDQVVPVLIRLHVDLRRLRIDGKALAEEGVDEEGEEGDEEADRIGGDTLPGDTAHLRVGDVIDEVEECGDAGEEEDGETEDKVHRIEHRLEAAQLHGTDAGDVIGEPGGDALATTAEIGERLSIDAEVGSGEEGSHRCTDQDRGEDAIEEQSDLVGL